MKHARPDYDRLQDPAGLIPEDEPVFLIRGQDKNGPAAVRAYAWIHQRNGGSYELGALAAAHADRMEAWQREHGSKLADLPAADAATAPTPTTSPTEPTP